MSVPFRVVIPARFASTRLPGKPLLSLAGKPMIAHVCDRASEANAQQIIVATDDERILQAVSALGVTGMLTSPMHESGTERITQVARELGWDDGTIIVNLQGDEPLLPAHYITQVAQALASQTQAGIATLAANMADSDEIFNPNAVKVVVDKQGYALYFSRAPIPWHRATFSTTKEMPRDLPYLRHIGLYAYTVGFLKRYSAWSPSPLESIEALEQLRVLWHGEKILVQTVEKAPIAGVDTLEDLQRVESIMKQHSHLN